MRFESWLQETLQNSESAHFAFLAIGFFCGLVLAGLIFSLAVHQYSKRMFRWRVLDELRRELRDPLAAYVEWLHAVSAEFSVWKGGLLPRFLPNNANDQYELNRLRRLYVDPRCQLWFNRLKEYEPVLGNFRREVGELWMNQGRLHDQFQTVFRLLDQNPAMSAEAGHVLENMAYEQSQLVSGFLNHLQYECLKTVADSRRKAGKNPLRPVPEHPGSGTFRAIESVADLARL